MQIDKKIGFWTVTSLVIGGQIGSGVFMLPSNLAKFGSFGLWCWILSGIGAVFLSLVFAYLCKRIPKTGGPHTYIEEAFGRNLGFLGAWGYWLAGWLTVPAIAIGVVGSIIDLTPYRDSATASLIFELMVIWFVAWINLKGVYAAGMAELICTILKIIPLFCVPLIALPFVDFDVTLAGFQSETSFVSNLTQASVLAMWGFLGLEGATTPAGSIENPSKTIPRALVVGTSAVALIYMVGTFAIMGNIENSVLATTNSPYAELSKVIFGDIQAVNVIISFAIAIVCFGTLQATTLTNSHISYGAAQDKLFPGFFAKLNHRGAPTWSIVFPTTLISILFYFMSEINIKKQFGIVIDIATVGYICVYIVCSLAMIKFLLSDESSKSRTFNFIVAITSLIFSIFILLNTGIYSIIYYVGTILVGFAIYLTYNRYKQYSK